MRKSLLIAVAAVLLVATGYLIAQTTTAVVVPQKQTLRINDKLAVKIVATRHGRVVGQLMANVDGQWVEVQLAPQDSLAGR